MMFFNFNKKLVDTGIFNGATDWHSHILPGVDDGVALMEETLDTLAYYEKIGIADLWLTPHIMEDVPNTTDELRAKFAELQEAYQGSVRLHLAAENMMDGLFNERLAANDFLPIGPKGDHLLVETSYYQPPIDMNDTIDRIFELGYTPILAHPERYRYMEDSDYDYLLSKKVKFQLNIISLVGAYGKPAQIKSRTLLAKGAYSFFGSDLHRLNSFKQALNVKDLKKDCVAQLSGIQNMIF